MTFSISKALIIKEYEKICNEPVPNVVIVMPDDDLLEWHFVLRGENNTPYDGGFYYGIVYFNEEFPFKAPLVLLLTPWHIDFTTLDTGEVTINWKYDSEVYEIFENLKSFMLKIANKPEESIQKIKECAQNSISYNLRQAKFCHLFRDTVVPMMRKENNDEENADFTHNLLIQENLLLPDQNILSIPKEDGAIKTYQIKKEDFVKIRTLGSGQTNVTVMEMYHKLSDKNLAVKLLLNPKGRFAINPEIKARREKISNEISMMNSFQNEFILSFYGYGIVDEYVWICMEAMEMSLSQFIKQRYLHFQSEELGHAFISSVGCAILQAILACYDKNIVHGDVKPANILLNRKGQIKLGDFGESYRVSKTSEVTGTLLYMPPERFEHNYVLKRGIHADVWSLAITLLETLHDENPIKMYSHCNLNDEPWRFISNLNQYMKNCYFGTFLHPSLPSDPNHPLSGFLLRCLNDISSRPDLYRLINSQEYSNFYKIQLNQPANYINKAMIISCNPLCLSLNELNLPIPKFSFTYLKDSKMFRHKNNDNGDAEYSPTKLEMYMLKYADKITQNKLHGLQKELEFLRVFSSNHNIVNLYGYGFQMEHSYICTERMSMNATRLGHFFGKDKKVLPEEIFGYLAINLINIFEDIHEKGYIYMGLRPWKVLINKEDGTIKLTSTDKWFKEDHDLCKNSSKFLPELYAAPERIFNPTSYNAKNDIWAIGLTMVDIAGSFIENLSNDRGVEYYFKQLKICWKSYVKQKPCAMHKNKEECIEFLTIKGNEFILNEVNYFLEESCYSEVSKSFIESCIQIEDSRANIYQLIASPFYMQYEKQMDVGKNALISCIKSMHFGGKYWITMPGRKEHDLKNRFRHVQNKSPLEQIRNKIFQQFKSNPL